MNRINTLALTLVGVLAFLFASCEKAPFITMNGPRSFNFIREGGSQTITFTCNRPWSVSSTESWVQITPSSGEASDKEITVTMKCSPNTTYDPRSATVTVKLEELSESITITQDTGIGLLVSPTTFELTNAAQTIEIEVQKNVQYSVAIDDESAKWIKQGGTKALTTDKVTFTISANESYDNREGKITFKQLDGDLSQTVTVRQSQTNGLFITTPDYNLSNDAHTLSVEIKANVEFEVTSQTEWIKFVETKALTPSTITLSVEANESYDNRTGTVLVKQKNGNLTGTITVNQKQTDYMTVAPTSFEVSNEAQSITIEVKDNVSYSVVIPDDAKSWVSVSSNTQTKALVDDEVVLAIAKNTTYDDREASITIKQTDGALAGTVRIKQHQTDGIFLSPSEFELSSESHTISVEVEANVEYDVTPDVTWIKVLETKALTSSSIMLSVEANPTYDPRSGKVFVKQKNGDQEGFISVSQEQILILEALPKEFNLSYDDQTIEVEIKNSVDYSITISDSGNNWISIVSPPSTKGLEIEMVCFSVHKNDTYEDRSAKIVLTENDGPMQETIVVKQSMEERSLKAVDLGLSVKWGSCNVGASKWEEKGDRFAWGEVETKTTFTQANYKWCQGDVNCPTKYTIDPDYSEETGVPILSTLELQDDAAYTLMGNGWRTPTWDEWEELMDDTKTTWTQATIDGIQGVKVTSLITHNSIFLPYGIPQSDDKQYGWDCPEWSGAYWSSNVEYDHSAATTLLLFSSPRNTYRDKDGDYGTHEKASIFDRDCVMRHIGLFVRPVKDDVK